MEVFSNTVLFRIFSEIFRNSPQYSEKFGHLFPALYFILNPDQPRLEATLSRQDCRRSTSASRSQYFSTTSKHLQCIHSSFLERSLVCKKSLQSARLVLETSMTTLPTDTPGAFYRTFAGLIHLEKALLSLST